MQRKMLAARADLADRVSEIAARRGTLYDFVNEILEQTIMAESMNITVGEIFDEMTVIKTAKESGFTFFPEKLIYDMIERVSSEQENQLMNLWYESGQWYGKYFGKLNKFEETMGRLLWGVSEFKISGENKNKMKLTCLSSKFSLEYTKLLSKFIEGALNSLGYEIVEDVVLKGIINLSFRVAKGG